MKPACSGAGNSSYSGEALILSTRRFFLTAGAAAAAMALTAKGPASAQAPPAPPASSPSPKPPPEPSALARELARSLQRDLPQARLPDDLVEKIAGDIESNFDIVKAFRKGGLKNSDEPDTAFIPSRGR
jgi:glucose/arabinose dehydrogenase